MWEGSMLMRAHLGGHVYWLILMCRDIKLLSA